MPSLLAYMSRLPVLHTNAAEAASAPRRTKLELTHNH